MNFKNLGYIPNPSPSMKMYQGATPTNSTSATGFLMQKSPILKQEYMFGNQNQMNASPFQDEKKRTKLNIVNFLLKNIYKNFILRIPHSLKIKVLLNKK